LQLFDPERADSPTKALNLKGFFASALLAALLPAGAVLAEEEASPTLMAIERSARCLVSLDADPAFAAIRERMPVAQRMGATHIGDPGQPDGAERAVLRRYRDSAMRCVPVFDGKARGKALNLVRLVRDGWTEQSRALNQLAEGAIGWGEYNRITLLLDRRVYLAVEDLMKQPGDF